MIGVQAEVKYWDPRRIGSDGSRRVPDMLCAPIPTQASCRQLLSLPERSAYRLQAHKRARLGVAAVAAAAGEREDMKVSKNTGRHMSARMPSRLPRGISKIVVRIMIVAYATDYSMSTF